MTIEEINELTVEQTIFTLIERLVDFSDVPEDESDYEVDGDITASMYERLVVNNAVIKPTLLEFQNELDVYKQELIDAENARIAKLVQEEDFRARFAAIKDIRGAFIGAGISVQNPAIKVNEIIESGDTVLLESIESEMAILEAAKVAEAAKAPKLAIGKIIRRMCEEFMDLVIGYNVTRELTTEQKNQMEATFAPILAAIQVYRPAVARSLVEAVTPDEVLVTTAMKTELLEVLNLEALNG